MFGAAEVTQFEDSTIRVQKKVLRFDVAMANAVRVDIGKRSKTRKKFKFSNYIQYNTTHKNATNRGFNLWGRGRGG